MVLFYYYYSIHTRLVSVNTRRRFRSCGTETTTSAPFQWLCTNATSLALTATTPTVPSASRELKSTDVPGAARFAPTASLARLVLLRNALDPASMWYVTLPSFPTQLCAREKERDGEKNDTPVIYLFWASAERKKERKKKSRSVWQWIPHGRGKDDNDDLLIAP